VLVGFLVAVLVRPGTIFSSVFLSIVCEENREFWGKTKDKFQFLNLGLVSNASSTWLFSKRLIVDPYSLQSFQKLCGKFPI
jgi:hypothetical protein